MGNRLSHSEVIEKFKKVHGDRYDYSTVEYKGLRHKIDITCMIHGVFTQTANSHHQGNGCPECGKKTISDKKFKSQETVLSEFVDVHGDLYDYSLVEYVATREPILIICRKHGVFSQNPFCHKRGHGCPACGVEKCSLSRTKTKEVFIAEANDMHVGKYDYSNTVYIGTHSVVVITCPIHGDFEQTPLNHLSGSGCPTCGMLWRWINKGKHVDGIDDIDAILYVIRCYDSNEEFYKIGITGRDVRRRFLSTSEMPYNYAVVLEKHGHPLDVLRMENKAHRYHAEERYSPSKKFSGHTECFADIDINYIKENITCEDISKRVN